MIEFCDSFAIMHFIEFNLTKFKILCFNCDILSVPISFNGIRIDLLLVMISILGIIFHLMFLNRDMIDYYFCYIYQRSDWVISDFRTCDFITSDRLTKTLRLHLYVCEL